LEIHKVKYSLTKQKMVLFQQVVFLIPYLECLLI